eukprot:CFRG6966T1
MIVNMSNEPVLEDLAQPDMVKRTRCTRPWVIGCIVVVVVLLISGIVLTVLATTDNLSGTKSASPSNVVLDQTKGNDPSTYIPQPSDSMNVTPLPSIIPELSEEQIANTRPLFSVLSPLVASWTEWRQNCGNGICEEGEWCRTCPQDCPCTKIANNGVCEDGENGLDNPGDCLKTNSVCGNGICESFAETTYTNFYETPYNCPIDCPMTDVCGNGNCESTESCFTCSSDCGQCPSICGDGHCNINIGESCLNCARDCGLCEPVIGDGLCAWPKENSSSSPLDCTTTDLPSTVEVGGVIFATMHYGDADKDDYTDASCESANTLIPNGWKLADNNLRSRLVAAAYNFQTPCLVLSDGASLPTKNKAASECHAVPLSVVTHSNLSMSVSFLADLCPARVLIESIESVINSPGYVAKQCPDKCNNHGTCDLITGKCNCDGRWAGTSCNRVIGDISITLAADWYKPDKGIRWQWQLQDDIDQSVDVPLYDVDVDTPADVIASLHAAGRKVMCYFSAGSWEEWRVDQSLFPKEVMGGYLDFGTGDVFKDEAWLDIRRLDIIGPLLLHRLDLAQEKGCDAIEFDNPDMIIHVHGLSGNVELTTQLQFNKWCAGQAHARGMGVALKNSNEFAAFLSETYDMVVNEEAFINGNIDNYWPFLNRNKPVLNTEYFTSRCFYCSTANAMGVSSIKKTPNLDACMKDCSTMPLPSDVTSVCEVSGFTTASRSKYPTNPDGWCGMTKNTDANECPATRFAVCDPEYGY